MSLVNYFQTTLKFNSNTPGTTVVSGFRDRTLAVKSNKKKQKFSYSSAMQDAKALLIL